MRRDLRFYLIGVLVTLAIVAVAWYASVRQPAPAGHLDNAYAAQVVIARAKVSEAQSMMGGGVIYYDGTLVNHGDRTLTGYTVELTFSDINGHPLRRVQRILLGRHVNPLPPRSRRAFEIGFDSVPPSWNQAPPTPRATAVYVQ
jgi:hypothetical protein